MSRLKVMSLSELKDEAARLGIRDPDGHKGRKATWLDAIGDASKSAKSKRTPTKRPSRPSAFERAQSSSFSSSRSSSSSSSSSAAASPSKKSRGGNRSKSPARRASPKCSPLSFKTGKAGKAGKGKAAAKGRGGKGRAGGSGGGAGGGAGGGGNFAVSGGSGNLEGTRLGTWTLGRRIGSGAFSDVYEGVPDSAGGHDCGFALKLFQIAKKKKGKHAMTGDVLLSHEATVYRNFLRGHPAIPLVPWNCVTTNKGQPGGYRFLPIQRLGASLQSLADNRTGRVPVPVAAKVGIQILEALRHIHSKRHIHRDVKPDNFMLGEAGRGEGGRVYCVDFGTATRYIEYAGGHIPFVQGKMTGTPAYCSASVLRGGSEFIICFALTFTTH